MNSKRKIINNEVKVISFVISSSKQIITFPTNSNSSYIVTYNYYMIYNHY